MKTYISIVSHGHFSIIDKISILPCLARRDDVVIVVRDNIGETALKELCDRNGIIYLPNNMHFGFAKNNNLNFYWLQNKYCFNSDDVFLVMNPDVFISQPNFDKFTEFMSSKAYEFTSILQYGDNNKSIVEPSARFFAGPFSLILERFISGRKKLIPNQGLDESFDWVSGAFIAVRCRVFEDVGGFCENYFMYYEDADFCLKCRRAGYKLIINTDINAIHFARYGNRKIFSRLFLLSVSSYVRFLGRYYFYRIKETINLLTRGLD